MLHQVGDLFELNLKLRCQKVNVGLKKWDAGVTYGGVGAMHVYNGGCEVGNTLQNLWIVNSKKVPRFIVTNLGSTLFLPCVMYVDICMNCLVFICLFVVLVTTCHTV